MQPGLLLIAPRSRREEAAAPLSDGCIQPSCRLHLFFILPIRRFTGLPCRVNEGEPFFRPAAKSGSKLWEIRWLDQSVTRQKFLVRRCPFYRGVKNRGWFGSESAAEQRLVTSVRNVGRFVFDRKDEGKCVYTPWLDITGKKLVSRHGCPAKHIPVVWSWRRRLFPLPALTPGERVVFSSVLPIPASHSIRRVCAPIANIPSTSITFVISFRLTGSHRL